MHPPRCNRRSHARSYTYTCLQVRCPDSRLHYRRSCTSSSLCLEARSWIRRMSKRHSLRGRWTGRTRSCPPSTGAPPSALTHSLAEEEAAVAGVGAAAPLWVPVVAVAGQVAGQVPLEPAVRPAAPPAQAWALLLHRRPLQAQPDCQDRRVVPSRRFQERSRSRQSQLPRGKARPDRPTRAEDAGRVTLASANGLR